MRVCEDGRILHASTLFRADGTELADVACRHRAGRGVVEIANRHALVLVRRGCFARRLDGSVRVLDPTLAYFISPGEEQRYDHPHPGGDDCTWLALDLELVLSLWGEQSQLPTQPLAVPPALDVAHRRLLADARRGIGGDELQERAVVLLAAALRACDARPVQSGRPRTAAARRVLADGVREALAADTSRSLPELARELAVSPHHLSRVFASTTGETISRHRMRLRTRAALERLAAGERDLAGLAAELGFADQSHLSRIVRDEAGSTPATMRRVLARS